MSAILIQETETTFKNRVNNFQLHRKESINWYRELLIYLTSSQILLNIVNRNPKKLTKFMDSHSYSINEFLELDYNKI